jgi:transcriptional regulator with XRE-family HTH domain
MSRVVGGTSHDQMYDAFGAYVRSQRQLAQLTLRQAAELASISNPYLSQIEHGLARPSISVISALANALSVSAETMLLRAAGIVSADATVGSGHTEDAICRDPRLDDHQRHALLAVLASFVGSSSPAVAGEPVPDGTRRVRQDPGQRPGQQPGQQPRRPARKKAPPLGQQPLEPPPIDEKGPDHA